MSKKLFIIITSIILFLFLVSLIGYYLILQNNTPQEKEVSVFKRFFPFGGEPASENTIIKEEIAMTEEKTDVNFTKKLRKLSSEPVAGAGLLDVKAGTIVRHIEKSTGHIFETELFSPNQNRISNTTIPTVYDALWSNNNSALIARYLKEDNQTIDTYSILIKETATTTENPVSATKFSENIKDVSVFGSNIFYLELNEGSSVGYISGFDGTKKTQIWNSPIKEVLSQYVNNKTVALTTKPHPSSFGSLFFVDTTTGQTRKILGKIPGLSALINDNATQVLYLDHSSMSEMFLFDISDRTYVRITPITFPEKCVWSKKDRNIVYCAVPEESINETSLTNWYIGSVSFADNIWKYNLKDDTSVIVGGLFIESGEKIDVTKPLLSENEQYLVFINKKDGSLWSLDLTK